MFCPNCGAQIPENAKFCSSCGAKIEEQSVSEPKTNGQYVPEVKQTQEYAPVSVMEPVAEPAEAQTEVICTETQDTTEEEIITDNDFPAEDTCSTVNAEPTFVQDTPIQTPVMQEVTPVQQTPPVPPTQPVPQAQPAPQAPTVQQPPQPQYGYGQQPLQYGQYQKQQQPPQQQAQYIPPQNQYQQPQYGQYQAPQQPYGAQYNQPFPGQPVPGQYYGVYNPPVNKTARILAALALCFITAGIAFLCVPLSRYIDQIIDDIKFLIENKSTTTAVAYGLVPLSLAAGMIIDFIYSAKSLSCKNKSGGLQITTFILASFYWVLVHDFAENMSFLLGNGEFSVGLTGGAWYFYDTKFINNGLLIAAILCFIALILQIIKMSVFRAKKPTQIPQAPPPYGYQY